VFPLKDVISDKKYCKSLLESGINLENLVIPSDTVFNKLREKIEEYFELYQKNELNSFLVESLLLYIVGELLPFSKKIERPINKNRETMLKVLDYIYENFSEELSLPFVASKFGYTTNYFSTLFNKFTAMNFNDYVNWVRYNKAVILLNDSKNGYTVTEIANICGFGSMNTFYRAKKKFSKS
jgi:AraC-like DNA-binding protein